MIPPALQLVLLDFDGVLVRSRHEARLDALARQAGCGRAQVSAALRDSGLERAWDSGDIDTGCYLAGLSTALGCPIAAEDWIAARLAGCELDPAMPALLDALASRVPVGVLSNNGTLMAEVIARLLPQLSGRVLCSGGLGVRKPAPTAFEHTLAHFGVPAHASLFIDDLFVNVRGARTAGLHADTARDLRSLRRVLRRYRLL